jgi:aryl sulfotransferase
VGPVRYRSLAYDSARWDGFERRAGDIIISTPPKCGTTWTQMICALLVLQDPELPAPLATLSPWLDMVTRSRTAVFADLEAQDHRRFIKTHTPLDGLPLDPDVTYLCVGRDPRDVALSMGHHRDNLHLANLLARRAAAAAEDGIELPALPPPKAPPRDELERFWSWVDDDTAVTESGSSLRYTVHHLRTFWDAPSHLDVVLLHYDELRVDLAGEMRRLADRLGIRVPARLWPRLVDGATFDQMRARPTVTVPGAGLEQWKDPAAFFRSGTSGQWRALLDEAGEERYAEVAAALATPELSEWLHRPPLRAADPATAPGGAPGGASSGASGR